MHKKYTEQQAAVIEQTGIKESFLELGKIQEQFNKEQVKFIVDTVAPGLNDKEVWLFLLKASILKLNPLLGEIFAYVSTDDKGNRRLVTIAGRNGKRNKALETGRVEYIRTKPIYIKEVDVPADEAKNQPAQKMKIEVKPWDGKLWGATCSIKIKGQEEPTEVTVPLDEYDTGRSVWSKKKETMIKKVAESQAIDASGVLGSIDLYDEAERFDGNGGNKTITVPQIEGGGEPADDQLLKTLNVVGGDMARRYTKQEALEEISRLNAEKGKKKAEKSA